MALLTIENVRSIAKATVELDGPITLIAGRNDAGKSSICLALAALVSGNMAPLTGKAKHDGPMMCRTGAKAGVATLSDGKGMRTLRWTAKGCDGLEEQGDTSGLPTASVHAAALTSFLTMPASGRNDAFWQVVPVNPTRAQLDAWLAAKGAQPAKDALWEEIRAQGWDGAAKTTADGMRDHKGRWQQITGETWGSAKGASWRASEPEAIDAEDGDLDELRKECQAAKVEVDFVASQRSKLPTNPERPTMTFEFECPDCGACHTLMIEQGKLVKFDPAKSEKELAEIRLEIASLDGKLSAAMGRYDRARFEIADREGQSKRQHADAAAKTEAAAGQHAIIERMAMMHEALGPNGVRKATRDDVIGSVNDWLAELGAVMGIGDAKLDFLDMAGARGDVVTMTIDGVPYEGLSGSRQWRARAMLQLALARRAGSDLVIMDGADILDQSNRNALIGGLRHAGVHAVINMTVNKPALVPDLASAGLGISYWVESNTARPLAETLDAAA